MRRQKKQRWLRRRGADKTAFLSLSLSFSLAAPAVEQLMEAGADARTRNNHGEKPVDVLVGAARQTEAGQALYKMLRQAEAQVAFASKDIVDDDDEAEDDDDGPSDDEP